MKKTLLSVSAAALIFSSVTPTVFGADGFVDIQNSYAKDAIVELQSMGILNGIDDTHFAPKDTLTRAQFTAIIVRALGIDASATVSSFTDVKGWSVGSVEAAFKAGIIEGVGNGLFAPNAALTREQAATILVRALQLRGKLDETSGDITFKDANKISAWAKPFIALAQQYGLIQGNGDNTFNPKGTTTREMAAMMGVNLLGALDDVKPTPPTTPPVTDPEDTTDDPAETTPPVNNGGGGVWYPPYTPPTTEPPVTEPPVTEPPVTEPPITEPPTEEPPVEVDAIVPVIALIGESVVNVVYGAAYVDAGATASDNKDGDVSANIIVTVTNEASEVIDAIDTTIAGSYTYHYNVSDAAGNVATEVTRSVVVAAEVIEPPVYEPTVITDVYLTSSNVTDSVYATVGDTVTLTFTTSEEVWKLSNFKINGSNPTTFDSAQTGDTWTNTATYVIEESDPNGPLTFQINVKNAAGIYSLTTEATTDGSSVTVSKEAPVISGATIIPDGAERVMLQFQTNEAIDLGTAGNLVIRFLDINGDEVLKDGSPIIKSKAWSGYLTNYDGSVKYSVGDENNEDYEDYVNVLPADTTLYTVVTSAFSYADSEWFNAIATISVEATDDLGNKSAVNVNMPTVDPANYFTLQDFGKNGTTGYNFGFKINTDALDYASIASITANIYGEDGAIATVSANTPERIAKYEAADVEYGGLDGQLSFDIPTFDTLEAAGVPQIDGKYESTYLRYEKPIAGAYVTGDLIPNGASITIVTKTGVTIISSY